MNDTDRGEQPAEAAQVLSGLVSARSSVRAFRDRDVSDAEVRSILDVASRAPSRNNTQPWRVYIARRPTIQAVADTLEAEEISGKALLETPAEHEPYRGRREQWERQLFGLMKLDPDDPEARGVLRHRDYAFHGAPVAMFVTVEDRLGEDARISAGMFVQTVLLAAEGHGMGTCVHSVHNSYEKLLRPILGISEHETQVCAIALGYADATAPANWLAASRASQDEWVHFVDASPVHSPTPECQTALSKQESGDRQESRLRHQRWSDALLPRGPRLVIA